MSPRYGVVAASGEEMLLDTIATIILAGMMLVPVVNIFAGIIVGAGLGGAIGALAGLLLALSIMAVESFIGSWFTSLERKRASDRAAVGRTRSPREDRHRQPSAATAGRRPHAARGKVPAGDPALAAGVAGAGLLDAALFAGAVGGVEPSPKSSASISFQ